MRTILLVAALLLPALALGDAPLATAAESVAVGDRLAESDAPLDLKAALLCYERALEIDRDETPAHRLAVEKILDVKRRLRELARPARERADAALRTGDFIDAERYLCEAISTDPFDHALRVKLADVLVQLRREAVEFQRESNQHLRLRLLGTDDSYLGVPPEYEHLTNDPRFALPARHSHKG